KAKTTRRNTSRSAAPNIRPSSSARSTSCRARRPNAMPFVRIDLARGRSAQERKRLGEIVYAAMRATINVPENDKFQIITEHAPDDLNFAESYLGSQFGDGIIFIQITLNSGRTLERKKA